MPSNSTGAFAPQLPLLRAETEACLAIENTQPLPCPVRSAKEPRDISNTWAKARHFRLPYRACAHYAPMLRPPAGARRFCGVSNRGFFVATWPRSAPNIRLQKPDKAAPRRLVVEIYNHLRTTNFRAGLSDHYLSLINFYRHCIAAIRVLTIGRERACGADQTQDSIKTIAQVRRFSDAIFQLKIKKEAAPDQMTLAASNAEPDNSRACAAGALSDTTGVSA